MTGTNLGTPSTRLGRVRGTTMLELLVALLLMGTTLSVATPLVVRHGRLLTAARHERLAVEELANQLEVLTALDTPAEVEAALAVLAPSELTAARLPGAQLSGRAEPTPWGTRVTLALAWHDGPLRRPPMTMAGWLIDPQAAPDAAEDQP